MKLSKPKKSLYLVGVVIGSVTGEGKSKAIPLQAG
jgi:hypothetical protein